MWALSWSYLDHSCESRNTHIESCSRGGLSTISTFSFTGISYIPDSWEEGIRRILVHSESEKSRKSEWVDESLIADHYSIPTPCDPEFRKESVIIHISLEDPGIPDDDLRRETSYHDRIGEASRCIGDPQDFQEFLTTRFCHFTWEKFLQIFSECYAESTLHSIRTPWESELSNDTFFCLFIMNSEWPFSISSEPSVDMFSLESHSWFCQSSIRDREEETKNIEISTIECILVSFSFSFWFLRNGRTLGERHDLSVP